MQTSVNKEPSRRVSNQFGSHLM